MKSRFFLGVLLIGGLPFLNSCKDEKDPEPPSPLVGVWARDVYQLTELPETFGNFEGLTVKSVYGDESYTLTFTNDKKYTRKLARPGPDFNDIGVWTYEGTDLTLDSDEADIDDEAFEVEGDITANQLVLSQIVTFPLLPDAVTDTLTDAWANTHEAELEQYFQNIDVKLLFLFEK
ncbi:MAG: hypothetical protein ABIR06_18140 [Cyclobacteriaceae bacterium]